MPKTSKVKTAIIAPHLLSQLNYFFSQQLDRTKKRSGTQELQAEIETLFSWAKDFAQLFLEARTLRANDLSTSEVHQSQELARTYIGIGNHDFFATCVDGRNMPTVMFSKPPHVGGVLRTPAGTVTGFMEGSTPGTVFIDRDSFVVRQIERLLLERPNQTIFYGLDSHLGCAARGLIHGTEGGKQQDKGLRADVLNKMMTARGILELRKQLFTQKQEVAEIIPVFFSFDPHCGSVVMGLEMHINLPEVVEKGYTEDVLSALANEGKIVRALDLLEDPEVKKLLAKAVRAKSADFRTEFPRSLAANWQAIHALYAHGKGRLYEIVLHKLRSAYEQGGWRIGQDDVIDAQHISEKTLRQKAKFLMKNMVTRYSIAGADHHWPYEHHKEDMVVITDGGYAPFAQLDAFSVFSRDTTTLLANTKLTIDLIRQFRGNGNAKDNFPAHELSKDQFISAPVLITNKAILRITNEEFWKACSKMNLAATFSLIDWDDPETFTWRKQDIFDLLKKTLHGNHLQIDAEGMMGFVDVIYELFDRLRIMMKDKAFRHMIMHGNVVILNIVVDGNRKPQMVVPFVV